MKRILLMLAFVFSYMGIFAQEDITITWLTNEDSPTATPLARAPGGLDIFMEFDILENLLSYDENGKRPNAIKSVQFYLDSASLPKITGFKVMFMRGSNILNANTVLTQDVEINSLEKGWNSIELSNEYPIEIENNVRKNIYIGCQILFTEDTIPLSAVTKTNPKQAWARISRMDERFYDYGRNFLIKAIASAEEQEASEILLSSITNIPSYKMIGENMAISGTVKNIGTDTIRSFKLSYEVDDVSSVDELSGLEIAPEETYSFTHSVNYTFETAKQTSINVTVSEPNNIVDKEKDNTLTAKVLVYSKKINRKILHEIFTSATCGPCKDMNEYLENNVFNNTYLRARITCVKYQWRAPGEGDPYYTLEGGARGNFYGNITAVPTIITDAESQGSGYSGQKTNALLEIPALAEMTSTADINNETKTVNLNLKINPVTSVEYSSLRLFATIVEKETTRNRMYNGERIFHYVMKKFMTDVKGNEIALTLNEITDVDYSYTFNGHHRLPTNASSPINHDIEHSVEDFNNLMVVYWLQDIETKEVYQSGETNVTPLSSINEVKKNEGTLSVYPNPSKGETVYVNLNLNESVKGQLSICDMVGKEVVKLPEVMYSPNQTVSLNISNLSSGIYFIRFNTSGETTARKLIISK